MTPQEREFAEDVMTAAIEGESLHWWASVRSVVRDADLTVTSFEARPQEPAFADGRADVRDQWRRLDAGNILNAATTIAGDHSICIGCAPFIAQALAEFDAGHVDDWSADAIVQVALFGEVVFG